MILTSTSELTPAEKKDSLKKLAKQFKVPVNQMQMAIYPIAKSGVLLIDGCESCSK
jgi:hypothetical protein